MAGTISVSSTIAVTLSSSIDNPLSITGAGTIDVPGGVALDLLSPFVWTVDNSGLLQTSGAYSDALKLGAGGSIANQAGGRIVGGGYGAVILGGTGSLTNAGLVQAQGTSGAAVTFGAGGVVTNIAAGTIAGGHGVEIGGHAGTVTNSGLVNGNSAAIYVDSGTVANLAGGMITSSTTGAQFGGYGFVTNSASATIAAAFGVVVSGTGGARIDNAGLIISTPHDGIGVFLSAGGTVSNATGGTIYGNLYGVDIENGARSVINAGLITASNGIAVSTTFGGPGTAYVGNTGSVVGSAGAVRITELPGSVANSGLIDGTTKFGVRLESGGNVTNTTGGTIRGNGGDIVYVAGGGTVTNAGTIAATGAAIDAVYFRPGYANRVIVDPTAVFVGTVNGGNSVAATAVSVLELAAGSGTLAGFGSSVINFGSIAFDPGASWTITGSATGLAGGEVINGFTAGDTIELLGVTETISGYIAGNLSLDGTAPLDLLLPGSGRQFSATTVTGGTDITVACFRAGARILTDAGEVTVERLRPGMRVVSLLHRRPVAVKWVGWRNIDCARHPRPSEAWPVRVQAGAFAPGVPHRVLNLSPDHAVYVAPTSASSCDGVLIPVRALINGASIAQVACDAVSYFHVELAEHGVLLAEGLPAESYLDTGNRSAFANGGGAVQMKPDLALRVWEREACAKLVTDGPAIVAVRQRLLARAEQLGWTTTDAPAPMMCVDGQRFAPHRCHDGSVTFPLPPGCRYAALLSRSTIPAHSDLHASDHRRLGLAVAALALDDVALPLDDPRLDAGWHAPEPGLRWTDGAARIALAGERTLTVRFARLLRYWSCDRADCRAG